MTPDTKDHCLRWAEVFDSWRVVPRVVLFGYCWFVWYTTNYIMVWYTQQPATQRGIEESATVGAIFAIVTGLTPWVFKIYSDNGRNWNSTTETPNAPP